MNHNSPIAVSGIGCLCAAGENLKQCMDSLFAGKQHSAPPTRFSSSHPVGYPVFEIPDHFTVAGCDNKSEILRTARLAVTAAGEALRDAGWSQAMMQEKRVGVCIGTTVGSAMNNEGFYREFVRGHHPDMNAITRFLNSNPAQVIAKQFGLTGPCQTVVNACSSGTDAIGLGASWIRSGICDAVVAGGADALCRVTYNGFISLMITDESICRPFDAHRKGLNLGEGAAVLVLESTDSCRARKQPARALALGYGTACDAYHLTAPAPDGSGLKQALTAALTACNKTAADISFINAHGTGTPDNDRVESEVLYEMLPEVPFLSTKGYTGHTLGAAGAIEAAFTVACLEAQKIPPSAGFTTPDPALPWSPVQYETFVNGSIAISQSLAFGGNNAVLVFEKGDT
jgi:3-oxoacyl-[acyl-carrier-protein] synthase-1/3-oxoacyl-[acyl-carrier-protein] synthase II